MSSFKAPAQLCLILMNLAALNSCRLNTESLTTVDTLARGLPNIVIKGVIYKEIENKQLTREVHADEFKVFSKENLVQVKKGHVTTYRDGEEQLLGEAESAEYNQESEDATVTGPIKVRYYPEETSILAQKLDWVHEDRILSSPPEGTVEIRQDNGTEFQGKGFAVDMNSKTVSYQKDVHGQLYAESDGEGKEEPKNSQVLTAEEQVPKNRKPDNALENLLGDSPGNPEPLESGSPAAAIDEVWQ